MLQDARGGELGAVKRQLGGGEVEPLGHGGLRVGIDEQRPPPAALRREGPGQIAGEGGFPNPAFRVGDRDDVSTRLGHQVPLWFMSS